MFDLNESNTRTHTLKHFLQPPLFVSHRHLCFGPETLTSPAAQRHFTSPLSPPTAGARESRLRAPSSVTKLARGCVCGGGQRGATKSRVADGDSPVTPGRASISCRGRRLHCCLSQQCAQGRVQSEQPAGCHSGRG